MLLLRCHQLLSGFLAKGYLPRVACLSNNDKSYNEVKPDTVHRSPGIYLMTEENPGKTQLGGHVMSAVRPVIASIGVFLSPFVYMVKY
jgi:hypothetical protein